MASFLFLPCPKPLIASNNQTQKQLKKQLKKQSNIARNRTGEPLINAQRDLDFRRLLPLFSHLLVPSETTPKTAGKHVKMLMRVIKMSALCTNQCVGGECVVCVCVLA